MAEKNAVKTDEKNDLEKALDGALADLKKATGTDLEKGGKPDFMKKDEKKDDGKDEKEEVKADGKEEVKGDEKDEDEDADDKAKKEGYRKGVENDLTKSAAVKNAVEVSKFLGEIVKSMAEIMGDMKNEMSGLRKSNREMADALVKSFSASNDMTKSLADEVASLGGRPQARKSIPAGVKIETLTKSARGDEDAAKGSDLSKSQIADKIANLEMKNEVPLGSVARFEAAGLMTKSVEGLVFGKSE